jgi:hypothetical protein
MKYIAYLFTSLWVLGSVLVSLHLAYDVSFLDAVFYIVIIITFLVVSLIMWFAIKPILSSKLKTNT